MCGYASPKLLICEIKLICFFFNDTATTEIYTLSLHDALPICRAASRRRTRPAPRAPRGGRPGCRPRGGSRARRSRSRDRKSTRLNSSHANISYAVFCLKKKKQHNSELYSLHYLFLRLLFHKII